MDWKQIVGVMLFGSIPSFLPLWLEDMWPVGSWQWGALTLGCLVVGIALINWDRWSVSFPKISFVVSEDSSQKSSNDIWFDSFLTVTAGLGFFVLLAFCNAYLEESLYGRQWHHSAFSADETQKAEDACVMKAYEAIGGGKFQRQHDRQDYIDSCMESQGFIRRKVEL